MPIYEYRAAADHQSCPRCREVFEMLQRISAQPLSHCPECGNSVVKLISWCRAATCPSGDENRRIENRINAYAQNRMWSHAAELADSRAEKTRDPLLRHRALDYYHKAGHDPGVLERHARATMTGVRGPGGQDPGT